MDWDLKAPSWDFAEFEREAEPDITHFVGSSSLGEQRNRGDCSVDLKLGRLGDFGEISMNKWNETRVSTMVSSSSSSSPMVTVKRGRASNNGTQTVSCLVDGCDADLSKCREYHRRHKVCEVHSKTPKVTVGGQEQRFCQQCSRFHMLIEFDEVKRSCRKRLDGHNRRRRKAQPEPLSINSGSLFPYHQGSRFLPYTNPPQMFPSTSMASPNWPGVVKMEEDTMVNTHYGDRGSSFSMSFSRNQKEGKRFPFLQVNELGDRRVPEASVCQPLLNTIASSEAVAGTGSKMFSDGFNRALDSDCALSLLSSPSTQRSGISISHVVQQPGSIPMSQPLLHHNNNNSLGGRYHSQGMNGDPMSSVIVSGANDAELSCQGIFHLGSNGSSQNGIPQALPFSWE